MRSKGFDVAIIGGGIVGTATAMALAGRARVVVVEAEDKLAAHQTGNNSGVIHSGLYYKPGSLKARNCTAGRDALYAFCEKHGIPYERCGKVVVASEEKEIPALDELYRRGVANGLEGLKKLKAEEIREYEPHATGIAGLYVKQTGIVNFTRVTEAFGQEIQRQGGEILLNTRFLSLKRDGFDWILENNGNPVRARYLINCGGLQSDRIARNCGVAPRLQIIPFRGEYYKLRPESEGLVRNLLYPVPDPRFPFLGVHFTRLIDGGVEAGPNAVLAFKREGYRKSSFSFRDTTQYGLSFDFWMMGLKYWKMGFGEFYRSYNRRAFVRALQKLIPELTDADVYPEGAGVRAQALESRGALVDDFRIVEADRQVHVLNAPSPAATAAISIGDTIAEMAHNKFAL
ncbi:L-2-hydroxyglutarate oxidase [candidate division KSB1 bacterium]|nr:L-2-hydroxyglutarate oxidase [candidate division KSB1 bacterium]